MSENRLTILVAAMIAAVPRQGGWTWAVLQYLLGLKKLGHDVFFVEPLDSPTAEQLQYFDDVVSQFGFKESSRLFEKDDTWRPVRRPDVLLNLSGMRLDPSLTQEIPIRVYIDLDPLFTQAWQSQGIDMRFAGHTHFATVGLAIGTPGCDVPTVGKNWITLPPPVVVDQWPAHFSSPAPSPGTPGEGGGEGSSQAREQSSSSRKNPLPNLLPAYREKGQEGAFTTVANWRGYGTVEIGGVFYGQKVHSLRQLIELPKHTREKILLAMAIHPNETKDIASLKENGWEIVDPAIVADTPDHYRQFVSNSKAEFGVAKAGYGTSQCGWFSDRSVCYLAAGRPVLAQDTGFAKFIPTGAGLLSFKTIDDAVAGIESIAGDYERHSLAARKIAEEYFDSDKVLTRLLRQIGAIA